MQNLFKKTKTPIKGGRLLQPLIEIRGRQCECCKNTTWLNQPINLQVHHIDGDRTNNELNNLQLLCLNCHSYTDNFGSKNFKNKTISEEIFVQTLKKASSIRQALLELKISDAGANYTRARKLCEKYNIKFPEKTIKEKYCKKCGKPICIEATYCTSCNSFLSRKVERPNRAELKDLIRKKPFTEIANIYGVTDNAIRKWCISENLPSKKKDIKSYSDKEWNNL